MGEQLSGGYHSAAVRHGDVVIRAAGQWSRLSCIAASIEQQVHLGNPAFDRHRDERHTDGYREDMRHLLRHRQSLLNRPGKG